MESYQFPNSGAWATKDSNANEHNNRRKINIKVNTNKLKQSKQIKENINSEKNGDIQQICPLHEQ